jgi:phosphatidate phosphatase LPIN
MACLRDIRSLFGGNNNPFYAGFGNRLTDALSYRSVNIPSTRIFTINSNAEVSLDLLTLNKYKSSYVSMREIVDHFFPPVGLLVRAGGESFTDFNYWRDAPLDFDEFSASDTSEDGEDDEDEGSVRSEDEGSEGLEDEQGDDMGDSFISRESQDEGEDMSDSLMEDSTHEAEESPEVLPIEQIEEERHEEAMREGRSEMNEHMEGDGEAVKIWAPPAYFPSLSGVDLGPKIRDLSNDKATNTAVRSTVNQFSIEGAVNSAETDLYEVDMETQEQVVI